MMRIVFRRGPFAGRTFDLNESDWVIGRSNHVNLCIDDEGISGRHARVTQEGDEWWIHDMQSSNGTAVNGVQVQSHPLRVGDRVAIGEETTFDVVDGDAPPVGPASTETPLTPELESDSDPELPVAREGDVELVRKMRECTERIRAEVAKVIVGQQDVLDQVLMCMIAGGHGLLVGLPGMAKTLMVRTIAQVLDLKFKRIQFTPDLMPTDITGTDVLETNKDTGEKEFRFIKGPLFCNLLLADEINRTPPKTQAALLEAMQEMRVTAGNQTFTLDEPFFVLATQNPIEQEGTYPLPEAQLDRFMFNIWVDYPSESEEEEIVGMTTGGQLGSPKSVLTRDEVLELQRVVREIPVSPHVIKYVIRLVRATRPNLPNAPEITRQYVSTGAGPRAGQYLVLAAKARAVLEGRIHVSCNDIRGAAVPVLRHRILTNFAADSEGLRPMDIVDRLLHEIPEPGADEYANG